MKKFFNKIRFSDTNQQTKNKIINTILILLLGIVLGIFSKWLDNMSINDSIWWQHILGILDLRNIFSLFGIWLFIAITISVYSKTPLRASLNVFLFFLGMCTSYHLYSICFAGFNPKNYMIIWYLITLISPVLAFICWYTKGKGKISLAISSLITCVMLLVSFNIGIWYFDIKSIIDVIIFIGTLIVLYTKPKNTLINLVIAFILAFILNILI